MSLLLLLLILGKGVSKNRMLVTFPSRIIHYRPVTFPYARPVNSCLFHNLGCVFFTKLLILTAEGLWISYLLCMAAATSWSTLHLCAAIFSNYSRLLMVVLAWCLLGNSRDKRGVRSELFLGTNGLWIVYRVAVELSPGIRSSFLFFYLAWCIRAWIISTARKSISIMIYYWPLQDPNTGYLFFSCKTWDPVCDLLAHGFPKLIVAPGKKPIHDSKELLILPGWNWRR